METDDRAWDLTVDISFDDSMQAETTISSGSSTSIEDHEQDCSTEETNGHGFPHVANAAHDECENRKSNEASVAKKTQELAQNSGTETSNVKNKDDTQASFLEKLSQFIVYTQRQMDPLNRMKCESRRRSAFIHHPSWKIKGKKNIPQPIKKKPKDVNSCSVPLQPQKSFGSTAGSTNQSLADLSCFDDSIVWSISDICAPTKQIHDDSAPIVYNPDDMPDIAFSTNMIHHRMAVSNSNVQNRVGVPNAQAKRTQDLRYGTTFHYDHDIDIIQTTKSFGDDYREEEFVDKKTPPELLPMTLWMDTFGVKAPCPSLFPGVCLSFSSGGDTESRKLSTNQWLEDEYYDSDPEHARFRHRRPRRAFVQDKSGLRPSLLRTESMKSRGSRFFRYTDSSRFDNELKDEHLLEFVVEEMKHTTMNIIWHPNQCADDNEPKRIVRSRAWIEMGSLLCRTVIHPKFMWKAAYEPNLIRRKINVVRPFSIDLLDIIGIYPVRTIDRKIYPFARAWCSFAVITVRDNYFLFEAEDTAMRDKIVFGLKLLVARLASKVLVAGEVAEDEFFTPGGRQVNDTWWLEEEEDDESYCDI